MTGCCYSIKHSFFVRKIISPIVILINIGLTGYLIVSNTLDYDKYEKRDDYTVHHVPNTTSNYYIVKANVNSTENCSADALFPFDVTTVYKDIISKEGGQNILFITVFWLSTIVAVLLSLSDIVLTIIEHCSNHPTYDEDFEENKSICNKIISSLGSQFLQKGSFLLPSYLIDIFDYSQLCLTHHTKASLFILHHTYIGIFISLCSLIYLVLWTLACWDSRRHQYRKDIVWMKCLDMLTCQHENVSFIFFALLCLAVVPTGIYGIFIWITSLMEFFLKTKALLIGFNLIVGVIHDLVKLCKHC
ncbi:hypothetical protein I4U23_011655 [Adineta vaga]|nr:hypothetical protein I4U23_011655 [Adineta vaga]